MLLKVSSSNSSSPPVEHGEFVVAANEAFDFSGHYVMAVPSLRGVEISTITAHSSKTHELQSLETFKHGTSTIVASGRGRHFTFEGFSFAKPGTYYIRVRLLFDPSPHGPPYGTEDGLTCDIKVQ